MTDILTKRIKRLPMEMSREIFSYLIPDPEKVEFRNEVYHSYNTSYSYKYEVAFFENIRIANITMDDNHYLSRIAKKNGKHRYYITREVVDVIQVEYNDREVDIFYYDFISKYIGKDLFTAMFLVVYAL